MDHVILISAVSFWEIALKLQAGKLEVDDPGHLLPQQARLLKAEILPVRAEHALRMLDLPLHHKDPFDRLLVAQAMVENATVVTRDAVFGQYPILTFW